MSNEQFIELVKKNNSFTYSGKFKFYRASDSEWCLIEQGTIKKVYKWNELIEKLELNKITL